MKEIKRIREELDFSKNPLIFFHDDPDGLCSFLLFYRHLREGKGVIVKTRPLIDMKFFRKVEEFDPDKIFILDIAQAEQEFIDAAKRPIIWIDHHGEQKHSNVIYYNPRKYGEATPISSVCYDVVEKDMWIGMVGAVGDWFLPHFTDKFKAEYPDLLPKDIVRPQDALFNTRLGHLIRIFSFILKGSTSDAMKHVKVLTRIDSPYEILEKQSARGRFIYKRFVEINKGYDSLLKDIIKNKGRGKMIVYTYPESKMSYTGDVTNELLYRYPDKVVIVGRIKSGEVKCSLRSPADLPISEKLQKALVGIEGYGGGHEHACGAVIKEADFPRFIENLKQEIKSQ